MSSWAGIESGAGPSTRSAAPGSAVAGSDASGRGADGVRPVSIRRMRRQARPVIGSLDAAGVMVQRNGREIVLGAAWILLPGVILNLIATTLAFDRYQTFKGSVISIPELLGGQKSATGIESLLWYLGQVINSLAACLVGGYVATLVVRRQMGLPLRVRSGYRIMLGRLPALVAAWAIGHCWFPLLVLILANVSSSGWAPLAIFATPLLLIASTMTVVAAPVIVIERLGPVAGLRRSWRMARASFGVLFGFVIGSALIGVLVQYGIAYLPRLMQQTGLISFGRFGWLIEGAAGQLGRLISMPLIAAATVLVYLDVRMTMEGMDIVLDADRAFGSAP